MGSSSTVNAWPGHIGAGGGQRGERKGAQHYTDASPTTMSHFRPLWFGLRGWPPASWSSLSSSLVLSISFFDLLLSPSNLFLYMFVGMHFLSVNLFPPSPSNIQCLSPVLPLQTALSRTVEVEKVVFQEYILAGRNPCEWIVRGGGSSVWQVDLFYRLPSPSHSHTHTYLQLSTPPLLRVETRAEQTRQQVPQVEGERG